MKVSDLNIGDVFRIKGIEYSFTLRTKKCALFGPTAKREDGMIVCVASNRTVTK